MNPLQLVYKLLNNRNRLPRFINRLIDYAMTNTPVVVLRILSQYRGEKKPQLTPPRVPADVATRVVIAPVNYAGQGTLWARALEEHRENTWAYAYAVEVPGGFAFPTDTEIPLHVYAGSRSWQDRQLATVSECSHVLIEAERQILGRRFKSLRAEVRELRSRGLNVAFLAHGTDVRVPTIHRRESPWSLFHDPGYYWQGEERMARANIAALKSLGGRVFVSTPDLKLFLPEARWCPTVIDTAKWFGAKEQHSGDREKPLVVHAPSKPLIKGTDLIEPALHRLADAGLIEYRRVVGVPSEKMPELYGEADIVLDQFRLGSYGVTAIEAMAAGCVVLGHITEATRETVLQESGLELPIVEATPDTIERVITELVTDRGRIHRLTAAGEEFVREVHSGKASARVLSEGWLDS